MRREYRFYVYIMASEGGTLYVGFANHLEVRVHQHKVGFYDGFSKKYGCHKLVYFEEHQYVLNAIEREKQIKRWRREKKENLIRTINPSWKDLSNGWYQEKDNKFFHSQVFEESLSDQPTHDGEGIPPLAPKNSARSE